MFHSAGPFKTAPLKKISKKVDFSLWGKQRALLDFFPRVSLFFSWTDFTILDKIKSIISGFVLLDQTFIAFDINMLQTQEKLPDLAVDSEAMRFILNQVLSRPRNQFTHQKMKTEVGSYLVGKLGSLGLLMCGIVKSILGVSSKI